jgi:exonuclease SbcD
LPTIRGILKTILMKILHTSDWHIGKKLMGRERYSEHRKVLDEIAQICINENVDLCLVAGDVYDTYTPSAEAEEIFYNAVKQIAKSCAVLIISGNHDDYVRLTAASNIAEELNIYIIGNNLHGIKCRKNGKCYPVESDSGYVVFENLQGSRVYINTLPYPNEARFKEGKNSESFEDKMSRWIQFGQRGNLKNYPSIFLSHIFVAGGSCDGTEREIDLGGARLVNTGMLPDCDYIALGHLHKCQHLGGNVYYSGAPMYFSFDEINAKKSVNVFDIDASGISNFKEIEITSAIPLARLQATSCEDGISLLKANDKSYVELTLNLKEPLARTQVISLNSCENLVSLKTNVEGTLINNFINSRKGKSAEDLFKDYYQSKFNCPPPDKLKELFLSLTEEE